MIQKTYFFLSSPLKPKRSSTILLFLSFSRESSMSECVKKNRRVFLCWVGRLTIACRVDYLHKGVLDNDGWNGHHDQAHIFLGTRIVIFFFHTRFSVFSFKCRLLHFSLQLYSFLHRLILKSAFVWGKKMKKVFFSNEQGWLSQDDAYDSMSLSGSRERFYDERECDIFRSSFIF